jgi:threonylcarbamoyladenosine tRNA methylthiotransferase CDKAL1
MTYLVTNYSSDDSPGVTQIDRVVEVVEETLKGNSMTLLTKKELPRLDLPKVRKNR